MNQLKRCRVRQRSRDHQLGNLHPVCLRFFAKDRATGDAGTFSAFIIALFIGVWFPLTLFPLRVVDT
jgi:hypothetical protein